MKAHGRHYPRMSITLPPEIDEKIEAYMKEELLSRSQAVARLLGKVFKFMEQVSK